MSIENRVARLINDLTSLEINCVMTTGLTARKMPRPRLALLEIAEGYWKKVQQLGLSNLDIDAVSGTARLTTASHRICEYQFAKPDNVAELKALQLELRDPDVYCAFPMFRDLGNAADWLLRIYSESATNDDELSQDSVILKRIQANCFQLKFFFKNDVLPELWQELAVDKAEGKTAYEEWKKSQRVRKRLGRWIVRTFTKPQDSQNYDGAEVTKVLPPKFDKQRLRQRFSRQALQDGDQTELPLAFDEYARLRKIWEIGISQTVVQSVVQLDGDVIMRVRPDYATREHQVLLGLHNQSVDISIKMWTTIVNTVADFCSSAIKSIFPKVR